MAENQNENNQSSSSNSEPQKGTIKFSTKLVKDSGDNILKINSEKRSEKK